MLVRELELGVRLWAWGGGCVSFIPFSKRSEREEGGWLSNFPPFPIPKTMFGLAAITRAGGSFCVPWR